MSKIEKDIDMNEARRKKLASFSAITPKSSFRYTPDVYKEKDESGAYFIPKEKWPVFIIRELTGKDLIEIDNSYSYNEGLNTSAIIIGTVSMGLTGWENYCDSSGNIVHFEKDYRQSGKLKDDAFRHLSAELIYDLYMAIEKVSVLTEDEKLGL